MLQRVSVWPITSNFYQYIFLFIKMGKNQRHKKTLKSEKSKIKLKTGGKTKFLPKGANVTDVNFKIKPILVPEQLKANKFDEPVTKRKLNFKELLTRLNHHNTSAKVEACEGLIELVKSSPQSVLELHLYSVVHGVCKLVLDIEKKVRQKAIKLISNIIEKVSPSKLSPFFDILTSYASCAMTHIDKNIQEDSLIIVDAYLQHTPLLIVKSFDKILNNFLTLISKLRSDSKLSRTLTVNLGSKMTSIKWRIKVLTRLQRILQVIVTEKINTNVSANNCTVMHAEKIGNTIPIYKGVQQCALNFLNYSSAVEGNNKNQIEQYVGVLMPLLYETWAEVVPLSDVNNMDNGATIIQQDAASVLSCVMGIFYLLWMLMQNSMEKSNEYEMKKRFLSKDGQKFVSHILNQFPYRQQDMQKHKTTKDMQLLEVNTDPKCLQENLLICYMFCVLYKNFPTTHYIKKAHEILDYLGMCLVNRNYIPAENIEILSVTLQVIFFENSKIWSQKKINIEELLDNVVHFHRNLSTENYGKIEIFNVLCDLVQLQYLRSRKYEMWLSKLPSMLCKVDISNQIVDTLSLLSRQNNKLFLDGLLKELPKILDNLPSIIIEGGGTYPAHLKIVGMFYYLPIKQEHVELFEKFVQKNAGSKMALYVKEVLQEKRRNFCDNC